MTTFVPVVSTPAGASLMMSDWIKLGLSTVSLYMDALLVKPGVHLLSQLSSLAAYVGGSCDVVLNASNLHAKSGQYSVRSSFDGQRLSFSEEALWDVIRQLKPSILIVPKLSWVDALSLSCPTMQFFIPHQEWHTGLDSRVGVWFIDSPPSSWQSDVAGYVMTEKRLHPHAFKHSAIRWLESESPILDAMAGLVYQDNGQLLDVKQPEMAQVFEPISDQCGCEACRASLSISYFHHLFTHTPGLCQRFLIQHNSSITMPITDEV